jgi:Mn-dependent DtxR family transcriptional regulator
MPRVGRTVQILRDLGLIDFDDEEAVVLTDLGRAELEVLRGA